MSLFSVGAIIEMVDARGQAGERGRIDMWEAPRGVKLAGGRLPVGTAAAAAAAGACLLLGGKRLVRAQKKAAHEHGHAGGGRASS